MGFAGGIAGAAGTLVLYPIDATETLRQSTPDKYGLVWKALMYLLTGNKAGQGKVLSAGSGIGRVYTGVWTATLGATPSPALYFGAYKCGKTGIRNALKQHSTSFDNTDQEKFYHCLTIHACAAACGNVISSAVFIPKELIKQQMQVSSATISVWQTVQHLIQQHCGI